VTSTLTKYLHLISCRVPSSPKETKYDGGRLQDVSACEKVLGSENDTGSEEEHVEALCSRQNSVWV